MALDGKLGWLIQRPSALRPSLRVNPSTRLDQANTTARRPSVLSHEQKLKLHQYFRDECEGFWAPAHQDGIHIIRQVGDAIIILSEVAEANVDVNLNRGVEQANQMNALRLSQQNLSVNFID